MVQVNVHEAKSQLSRLIEAVLAGERVTIARAGRPVVDLVRHRGVEVTFGAEGWVGQRFDSDAFDAVDPQILEMFYGPEER